ncbi:hypothetical protein BAAM0483_08130 [Bifidobacterium animalis subsp. animalis MCC 0483]|uniref:Uncharacterized protein n=1 Tax=Bifidobacterium animalis subsp. animalis MCC 0483 TaxID=1365955 RepID=A0AB34T7I0_9BIFI|nr:hypothetical protein [Bifidobacterium animalis]KOA48443.1 hypothetical protein BAAM0483_08130 [Bifidobacterium animalis subsp. animalis MCC 0483]
MGTSTLVKGATEHKTETQQTFEEVVEDEFEDIELPPIDDDDNGDGERVCEWGDEVCTQTPEYYTVAFCQDPACNARHRTYLCKEHYAYRLNSVLCHLAECDGVKHAASSEERAHAVAAHICGFGRIGRP